MRNSMKNVMDSLASRRSLIKKGVVAASTAGAATGLLGSRSSLLGQGKEDEGKLTKGDVAILRFLAAAEIIESDLWVQYNELGGVQDSEVPGITGEAHPTSRHLSSSMETCPSIFTIIPRMRSPISSSSMRI